ncbi:hypothetical protein DL96DRAFT_1610260 [Flagelloscypha sp. PMI_526]|nr:hypothetical protein DL96DRAFT_1610260 [Flagelloscypha sp. PMI_526]
MSRIPRLPDELQLHALRLASRHIWAHPTDIARYVLVSKSAYESISFELYHTISITEYRSIAPLAEVLQSKPPSFFALRTRGLFLRFGRGKDGRAGWLAAWETLWGSLIPMLTTLQYLYADDLSTTDLPVSIMKSTLNAVHTLTGLRHFFLGQAFTRYLFSQKFLDISWGGAFTSITHLQLYPFDNYGLSFNLMPGNVRQEIQLLRRFKSLTHLMFVVHKDGEISSAVQIIESFLSLTVIVIVTDSEDISWPKLKELRTAGGKESNMVEMEIWQAYDLSPGRFKEVTYECEGHVWERAEEKLAARRQNLMS